MSIAERSGLIEVFSNAAEDYDLRVPFFQPLAADLLDRAGVGPGQRVLDIGCGRGAVTFQAAQRVGESGEVVGIDIAEGMVNAIAADVERRGVANVSVHLMDGQRPDFAPASFDHVLGSMSIIMVPSISSALSHYRTLLRDGGTVGFTAPAMGNDPLEWRMGPFYLRRFLAEALPELTLEDIANYIDVFHQIEPHRMLTDLREAGYRDARAVDVITRVQAPTAQEILGWTFTHGARVFWNMVPEPRRSEYAHQWIERIESEFAGSEPYYDTVSRIFFGTK
ncbi:MAG TPA: methyltransferase domain-containing protein [Jatrophihabitans sp.]|jgi:O-methyltransferase/aklanonic acid methyltransferase|nr:methyltransferase domain-containing protein [Jatrophihabitans sp.]